MELQDGNFPLLLRLGSYIRRNVGITVIGLVAVLVFLWGINYLRMTTSIELQSGLLYPSAALTAANSSSDNVVLLAQNNPLVVVAADRVAPTATTITAVPPTTVLITTAATTVSSAKVFLTTMKRAVLLSFQRFSRSTWPKGGGNDPIKAFIQEIANKCVNHLSAIYRRMLRL